MSLLIKSSSYYIPIANPMTIFSNLTDESENDETSQFPKPTYLNCMYSSQRIEKYHRG